MYGNLLVNKNGRVESPKSAYQPPTEIRDITKMVKEKYEEGESVLSAPLKEYDGLSLTQRANQSQHTWLSHPDAPFEGEEEWRFNGVRPITRNRVISTTARLTSKLLYPKSFAQNDEQEEDRQAAYAMDALVEHNIRQSNYDVAFLFGVIGALVNPINYFQVEYCESWQQAWNEGKYERVMDDIYSGFQHSLIPMDEILFGNAYVYEWQMQDWIIRKRRVSYEEMEGKFSESEYWPHVTRGVISMVGEDGFFYNVSDINDDMVGHVNFKHRRSDCEIDFVNGVYLSNPNSEYNPFYHRKVKMMKGKMTEVPMYNSVKYGFEPIDAMRFIGYKSLVDKMQNDQEAVDREWQDYFDASRIATHMPVVTMGAGKLDKSVVAPAAVTELGKNAKAIPLTVSNPSAALAAAREAERSANETSIDPQASGMKQGPQKTKGEAFLLEQNTDTQLSLPAKMIARMVKDIGSLMVNDIIRHQTIGEAGEIVGEMFYKSFVVNGRVREGKEKTTYIKFTDRFAGREMSPDEKEMEEYSLMSEAKGDREIIEVNPSVFARIDFLLTADADELKHGNDAFERSFKVSVYDKAIANPLVQRDPEAMNKITRDFLFEPVMKGRASKYLPNIKAIAAQVVPGMQGGQQSPYQSKDIPQRVVESAAMGSVV